MSRPTTIARWIGPTDLTGRIDLTGPTGRFEFATPAGQQLQRVAGRQIGPGFGSARRQSVLRHKWQARL